MLLDKIDPEKWYNVRDTSKFIGCGVDSIRRWIYGGHLQALILPGRGKRRPRIYRSTRIQGREIIRFVEAHLTVLQPVSRIRTRVS
jgi:hypothetical protein